LTTRDELGVSAAAYINGAVEAASELRRYVLDCLRNDKMDEAETMLEKMDEVYGVAISIDYPDALTHGLRRTTDAFRAVLERTRGDVTTAAVFLRARNS
jgi:translin